MRLAVRDEVGGLVAGARFRQASPMASVAGEVGEEKDEGEGHAMSCQLSAISRQL